MHSSFFTWPWALLWFLLLKAWEGTWRIVLSKLCINSREAIPIHRLCHCCQSLQIPGISSHGSPIFVEICASFCRSLPHQATATFTIVAVSLVNVGLTCHLPVILLSQSLWLRAVDQSKASMLRASVVVASKFRVLILSAMYGGRYARIMHRIGIPKFMRPIHPDLYPSVFCLICSVE